MGGGTGEGGNTLAEPSYTDEYDHVFLERTLTCKFIGPRPTAEQLKELVAVVESWGVAEVQGSVRPDTADGLKETVVRYQRALEFYANPENYHACGFWFDSPTGCWQGDFGEDFKEDELWDDGFYERPMPGVRARDALRNTGTCTCRWTIEDWDGKRHSNYCPADQDQ
jgi:hypothetical protein